MSVNKLNLITTRSINPQLTANDWDLYTSTKNCAKAATALNTALATAVNSGANRADVEKQMSKTMMEYAELGAADTEPYAVLENLLNHIYPRGY